MFGKNLLKKIVVNFQQLKQFLQLHKTLLQWHDGLNSRISCCSFDNGNMGEWL